MAHKNYKIILFLSMYLKYFATNFNNNERTWRQTSMYSNVARAIANMERFTLLFYNALEYSN